MGDLTLRNARGLSFTESVLSSCQRVEDLLTSKTPIVLNGSTLDVGAVVVVAQYGQHATMTSDPTIRQSMEASVDFLDQQLQRGEVVYGVNTGFGGSADTRTTHYAGLQKALIQMQTSCVLLPSDRQQSSPGVWGAAAATTFRPCHRSHSMPIPVVRAAMLTRCNSLLRGHSAVRPVVVEHILTLLRHGMTPVVPLRGSISASGDLAPLSYIAGTLEGNPDISVHVHETDQILPADDALRQLGLPALDLGPKEGLGLLNGTAFSCGAASLVLFEANQLLLLSQLLTAMATEALAGQADNYHPFIAAVRPHDGQIEAAVNIFGFLADSRLAARSTEGEATGNNSSMTDAAGHAGLSQDRYALRTATQWLGPQLETMALALRQVATELNSTTDNPLISVAGRHVHHGGNFQAAAITSAMEKTLGCVQMVGKMLFAQCSELLNPALSHGLPPNLSLDDPSLSYAFKGLDINMAAYLSELGYLNHPVSNHVQSAEMHNQSLNSLALVGCRYAADAVEVLALMTATFLYVLCQALDLRVLQTEFLRDVRLKVDALTDEVVAAASCQGTAAAADPSILQHIRTTIWAELMYHWSRSSTLDLADRCTSTATSTAGTLLDLLPSPDAGAGAGETEGPSLRAWKRTLACTLRESYETVRATRFTQTTTSLPTPNYLCGASRRLYAFVREELGVPLHRGFADHPTVDRTQSAGKLTIGSQVSKVYMALREGRLRRVLLECW
ncbi:phenylalanine ammonia-lyase [Aspergillus fijiensis CBS 313.89]|uniref:Phenylalanine ammonia-lyase n=1 Tax=Aspergillus fijiensis CBS 313.89 TaxID=1448319 RepID=A0A8G1VVW0_9EURO|nr:phenylalanine ammonia-lyase [Aspergillus fijiensis CBS 313.89]RAK73623.1 phenylalanine ammonia-lyase [Aspergillus fijiensis CBS 313.89]